MRTECTSCFIIGDCYFDYVQVGLVCINKIRPLKCRFTAVSADSKIESCSDHFLTKSKG